MCDSNIWIGVNPRVVVAPFARGHLWCICVAVSVGPQCVVARFARRHFWGICAAVSVGSQCMVARYKKCVPDAKYTYVQNTCTRTQSPTHLYTCVHVVFGVVHKDIYRRLCDGSTKCMCKSKNTEDKRRVLKGKTSPRLPSNLAG